MTQKRCVARHVCDFYFIVTFCDLTLTFCKYALCAYVVSFEEIYPALWVIPDLANFRTFFGHKGGQMLFDLNFDARFGILSSFSIS